MNSQKSLIVSVIIALLILGGAVAFVHFRTAAPSSQPAVANAEQVTVDALMTSCTRKDQCIIVDTKCSFCCDYVAINAKSEELYNQLFDKTCKNYSGTYCQCSDLSSFPSCVNGTCQMVKWSENKPIKTPPAPAAATPAPVAPPAPSQPSVSPVVVPESISAPEPAPDAFGQPPVEPQSEATEPPPSTEDLFAPLPESIPVPAQNGGADVIRP